MKHLTELVLGDWSGDGHNQSITILIESNLNRDEIYKAYEKTAEELDFDLIQEVAFEYEDNIVTTEQALIINSLGIQLDGKYLIDLESTEPIDIWKDDFVNIFLAMVKRGNPSFEYKRIEGETIEIGGYGLFFN